MGKATSLQRFTRGYFGRQIYKALYRKKQAKEKIVSGCGCEYEYVWIMLGYVWFGLDFRAMVINLCVISIVVIIYVEWCTR